VRAQLVATLTGVRTRATTVSGRSVAFAPASLLTMVLTALLLAAPGASADAPAGAAASPADFARSAIPAPRTSATRSAAGEQVEEPVPEEVSPPAAPGAGVPIPEPPVPLTGVGHVSRWSFVDRPVVARTEPSPAAPSLMRLRTVTPERTANLVVTLERQRVAGTTWVRVRLPMLPNNTTGWVPRSALSHYVKVRTHLFVDARRKRLRLERRGRTVLRARVGVGQKRWPTPTGEFFIRNQLHGFDSPMYGPLAFGTSARSAVLTDWPGGGFIGIHGTNRPGLLPGRVSHGCIRMRNRDILRLARLLPIGTPVTIS
jgi:lipoprotein-anchoring transpeptidase ErfK/SrfK